MKPRRIDEGASAALLVAKPNHRGLRMNGGNNWTLSSGHNVQGHRDGAMLDPEQRNRVMKTQIDENQERRSSSDSGHPASEDANDAPQMEVAQGLNDVMLSEEMVASSLIRSSQQNRSMQISQI